MYKKAEFGKVKALIDKQLEATGDSLEYRLRTAERLEHEKRIDSCELLLNSIKTSALSDFQKADFFYLKARAADLLLNRTEEALDYYSKARTLYRVQERIPRLNKLRYYLHYLVKSNKNTLAVAFRNLDSLQRDAVKYQDTTGQILASLGYAAWYFQPELTDSVEFHLKKALALSKATGDLINEETAISYYGLHYLYNLKDITTARDWLDRSVSLSEKINTKNALFYAYLNRATVERFAGDRSRSLYWMFRAKRIGTDVYDYSLMATLNAYISDDYEQLGKKDSALTYFKQSKKYSDSLNTQEQNRMLLDFGNLETENENIRIRLEKEKAENERNRNRNIAWSLGGIVVVLAVIGTLAFTNQQRKRKIAEQQQQLEQEKVNQLLKDQELQSIDAMISGQEKERQRLANDLHDNLGSLLATLKLHFENYKGQTQNAQQEKILNNTDQLLDEAYQKVRGMAHNRNTGVVAKYGLLPAIENFAAKVSASQRLNIDVHYNDFEERLENSTEITLFRIVQELITNVIKHAKATEVQLQLTAHEDQINILIEDNGKGFDASAITPKEGMGLHSIKKRVELVGGTFEIDSTQGFGTCIIINFPTG
ncbi:sensor histidine kinase [Flavobacteriaceae bacterium M23B6Z8]